MDDEQLKRKSKLALWTGIAFAFIFAITWGFPSGFGLITFSISAYCFFLYLYWQPRAPRATTFNRGHQQQKGFTGTIAVDQTDLVKRVVKFLVFGIFGLIAVLMMAEIILGGDDSDTVNYADESFDDTTASNITDVTADWIETGNEFYQQQQFDSAAYYYDLVLAEDPQNGTALYNKGLTSYERQEFESANALFEESYSQGMRTAFLSQQLGQRREEQGDVPGAVALYKEALSQDATLAEVYDRLIELDAGNAETYRSEKERNVSSSN